MLAAEASTTILDKDELLKMKRTDVQKLCKENNIKAIGKTDTLIESLLAHFAAINISSNDSESDPIPGATQNVATPKPLSRPGSKLGSSLRTTARPQKPPNAATTSTMTSSRLTKTPASLNVSQSLTTSRSTRLATTELSQKPTATMSSSKTIKRAIEGLLTPSRTRVVSSPQRPSPQQTSTTAFPIQSPADDSRLPSDGKSPRSSLFSSRSRTVSTPATPSKTPTSAKTLAPPLPAMPRPREPSAESMEKALPVSRPRTGAPSVKEIAADMSLVSMEKNAASLSELNGITETKAKRNKIGSASVSRVQSILKKSNQSNEPAGQTPLRTSKRVVSPSLVVSPPRSVSPSSQSVPSPSSHDRLSPKHLQSKASSSAASTSSMRTSVRSSTQGVNGTTVRPRTSSMTSSPKRTSQARAVSSLVAAAGDRSVPSLASASIQAQVNSIAESANADRLLLHGTIAKVGDQQITLKNLRSNVTSKQSQMDSIVETTKENNQLLNATCDRVTDQQSVLDSHTNMLDLQACLITELQRKLAETVELLEQTRQEVAHGNRLARDASIDVQSCVSQYETINISLEQIQKKQRSLEKDVLVNAGKMSKVEQEMGDVDVALESERDRVTAVADTLKALQSHVEGVLGPDGGNGAGSGGSSGSAAGKKRLSLVLPPKSVASRPSSATSTHHQLHSKRQSLSRASISSSIHRPNTPGSLPTPITPEIPKDVIASDNAKDIKAGQRTSSLREDFRFPSASSGSRSSNPATRQSVPSVANLAQNEEVKTSTHPQSFSMNNVDVVAKRRQDRQAREGSTSTRSTRPSTPVHSNGSRPTSDFGEPDETSSPLVNTPLGDEAELDEFSGWNHTDEEGNLEQEDEQSFTLTQIPTRVSGSASSLVGSGAGLGAMGRMAFGNGRTPFASRSPFGSQRNLAGAVEGSTHSNSSSRGGSMRFPNRGCSIDIDAVSVSISDLDEDEEEEYTSPYDGEGGEVDDDDTANYGDTSLLH